MEYLSQIKRPSRLPIDFGRVTYISDVFGILIYSMNKPFYHQLYGLRFYFSLAWLDIPWMRALHGTANALGFGLAGVMAWNQSNDK